jgi:hypothetical protein
VPVAFAHAFSGGPPGATRARFRALFSYADAVTHARGARRRHSSASSAAPQRRAAASCRVPTPRRRLRAPLALPACDGAAGRAACVLRG